MIILWFTLNTAKNSTEAKSMHMSFFFLFDTYTGNIEKNYEYSDNYNKYVFYLE